MAKIKLICDSTSDLSEELYKEIDADICRLKVNFGEETYVDGETIDVDMLYKMVDEKKQLPKTSACSIGDYLEMFQKYIDKGYQIIFVSISGGFSSNVNNAMNAKNMLEGHEDDIMILDSEELSSGIGLQLMCIHRDIEAGLSLKEVYDRALERRPRVYAAFSLDRMEYLHKGGRCSGTEYFFGRMFNLHPIIRVEHGKMIVHKIIRGKTIKALNFQIQEFKEQYDKGNVELNEVFITHSMAPEYCDYMYKKLCEFVDPSIIKITEAGSIISSHCGKGTIGLLYITKEKVIK